MPPCSQMTTPQLESKLCVEIARTIALAGNSMEVNDLKFAASELANEIFQNFRMLSFAEVAIALDNGVKGRFGAYFGINVVSVVRWLTAYLESEERKECVRERIKLLELRAIPQIIPLTAQELYAKSRQYAIEKFDTFLERGEVEDWGNCTYDFLVENGIIDTPLADKHRIFEQARQHVIENLSHDVIRNPSVRHILTHIEQDSKNERYRIVIQAQKIALREFFEKLRDNGVHLSQIINP